MKPILAILVIALAGGAALAQSGSGSAEPPAPAPAADARKACTAAMNADPTFAADVVKQAQGMSCSDAVTLKVHEEAQARVQTNEKHVIMAYAAMWVIAAGFVLFLWRRQQALKTEIAQLRRELDAATKDAK